MTAQIIFLADHRLKPEPKRVILDREALLPAVYHPFVEMWLANLMMAAELATMPLWPGGIDDLDLEG